MSLAMTEHRRARSPRRHWRCPSTEERGVPDVAGDVRAPRSEESPASLAMFEHRGVLGVAGDVRAPKSEESPASLAMFEYRVVRSPQRRWRCPSTEE